MRTVPVTFADVVAAYDRVAAVVRRTRTERAHTLEHRTGHRVHLKYENEQETGSFKIRGAWSRISRIPPGELSRGVVAASSGNHAQGVARAAALAGCSATVFMPTDATPAKVEAVRRLGARVELYDREQALPTDLVTEFARATGATPVPPFDDPDVIAGQGTAALELFADAGELDAVFVPLGGGGLLAGTATVFKTLAPRARVIGVEPEGGDDWVRSRQAGRPVLIDPPRTIADGARTRSPGELTFAIVSALVDDVVTVTDEELTATVRLLALSERTVVEPTGALGAAGLLANRVRLPHNSRVGVILSGGNIAPAVFAAIVAGEASRDSW